MKPAVGVLGVLGGFLVCQGAYAQSSLGRQLQQPGPSARPRGKVVAEVYVMSKCPFCARALPELIKAVRALGGLVELRVDYILSRSKGGLRSLHGPDEVTGDMQQLCARAIAPSRWMDFLVCQEQDFANIPANGRQCAKKAGVSWPKLRACVQGGKGAKLLEASARRARARGAFGAPTFSFGGQRYFGLRTERAFLRALCAHLPGTKPQVCTFPPTRPVRLYVLTDRRCRDRVCQRISRIVSSLSRFFEKLEVRRLDYGSPEGKRLYLRARLKYLPAILFDESLDNDPGGRDRIQRWLVPAGPYRRLKLGARFDPTAEICDNGKDDTGNGLVDCRDPTCRGKLVCRREIPGRLDVFIMPHCPFCRRALPELQKVARALGRRLTIKVHLVGRVAADGTIHFMHGPDELEEAKREACVLKHYRRRRRFLAYLACRAQEPRNANWRACARSGIRASVIEQCVRRGEGERLVRASIDFSDRLGIRATPTWLANNKFLFNAIQAKTILDNFCAHNRTRRWKRACARARKALASP